MRAWPDVEALAKNAIHGVVSAGGRVDEELLESSAISYFRSCFFTRAFKSLRNRSVQLEGFAKAHDAISKGDAPGRALIVQAYGGVHPCSLEGLIRIAMAIAILRDHPLPGAKNAEFAVLLSQAFPDPNVLPAGSIIPSLHTPDLDALKSIRLGAGGDDRMAFSRQLLEGTAIHERARPGFIGHLEDGYVLPKGKESGRYKLTLQTALVMHEKLAAIDGNIAPLSELIPVSADSGPRSGQVSKGLPTSFGNLVP